MAQQTAITLTDATPTTPVNRVFNPAKKEGELYRWDYRGAGIVAGYDQLSISTRLPTKQLKSTKVVMRLQAPVLEVTSPSTSTGIQPAPTVAFTSIGEISLVLPERSNLQNRKDLLAMMRDLIDEALVTAVVESYDAPYF